MLFLFWGYLLWGGVYFFLLSGGFNITGILFLVYSLHIIKPHHGCERGAMAAEYRPEYIYHAALFTYRIPHVVHKNPTFSWVKI